MMIFIALLVTFPPLAFLWGFTISIFQSIKENKTSKVFESIVNDMREEIEQEDNESVNVAIIENRAYWVSDNTFYVAAIVNGEIDHDSRQPVNAFEMSSSEIRKMLFILDNLEQG